MTDNKVADIKMKELITKVGDAFYLLDSKQFCKNFIELKKEFTKIYSNFNIAYSYKTNYIPKLCSVINSLDGFAETVSDMEMEIALKIGVDPKKIIWNGPYKNPIKIEQLLIAGGTVNIDSMYELDIIENIAKRNNSKKINIGVRCNFDISDGTISRFGFDVNSKELVSAFELTKKHENIHLIGVQCHYATRRLETWKPRVKGMLELIDFFKLTPERIDLGGGMFGKMDDSLKKQFDSEIPTYSQYAQEIAPLFADHFKNVDQKPMLLIEPGSALVGDCMKFVAKVINIKNVRGKTIATLLGSIYNINPTLNKKNPPIHVYATGENQKEYTDLDFGGFTCIESDYLYRHFNGRLAINDMVEFGNVGSYSVVLKPPFILPNFPVIEIDGEEIEIIKKAESFNDLFSTYIFSR